MIHLCGLSIETLLTYGVPSSDSQTAIEWEIYGCLKKKILLGFCPFTLCLLAFPYIPRYNNT
jgi:hypothetical protein